MDVSLFAVVVIVIAREGGGAHHREGGGGGRHIQRGPRKEREQMTISSPRNDDGGNARFQR
jgi:hypothetical protein